MAKLKLIGILGLAVAGAAFGADGIETRPLADMMSDRYLPSADHSPVRTMPLSLALEDLVPSSSGWTVLVQSKLKNKPVRIEQDKAGWMQSLKDTVKTNHYAVVVNEAHMVLCVAVSEGQAESLLWRYLAENAN